MAVRINVTSQKYYNQFRNGVDFDLNLTEYTNNLAGSVMEKVKVVYNVDISWGINYASQNFEWDLTTSGTTLTIVSNNGVNFKDEGFSAGDVVDMGLNVAGTPVVLANSVVDSVTANVMIITTSTAYTVPTGIIGIRLECSSPLTALKYKFGLIGNNENFNVNSKVSGNDQGFYGSGIGAGATRSTAFVDLTRLGNFKDWNTGTMKARYVSNPSTYEQRFEIEHIFTIVPYYLDGELSNLQNNLIPPLLNGLNSLKYVFSPGFRTVLSNPNTEKRKELSENLGSIAWFNQNFNGFQNLYNVVSTTYQNAASLSAADGLLIGSKTLVTLTVAKNSGSFSGGERFGTYISYLPEESEYQDTTTSLLENFLYDNALNNEGLASVNSDIITSLTSTIVSGQMVISMEVEYLAAQKIFLSSKFSNSIHNYIIGVQLGDTTLTSGNSDRVILLADVKQYDESADISGLMAFEKFEIYPHDKPITDGDGSTDLTAWNEDGFTVDFGFNIDLNKEAFINSLDIKLVAEKNNEVFELDSFNYPIGASVVSGGIQQLNISTNRGYILKLNDQFNEIDLSVGSNVAGVQSYNGRFSQKISWQDWIENLDVDSIFYDNSKPENNRNYKASNYSALNGYNIKVAISSNLYGVDDFGNGGLTDYLFLSPSLRVFDYDLDINEVPLWSGQIETFAASTLTNLSGAVLTGKDTLFRTTWTNSGGAVTDLSYIVGINRIEETSQIGYSITEMSSINLPAANQILKPYTGLYSNVYLSGGNVVVECLIDGSIAKSGIGYNLSARIFNCVQNVGKMTEAGVYKVTELNVQKIIE